LIRAKCILLPKNVYQLCHYGSYEQNVITQNFFFQFSECMWKFGNIIINPVY